MHFCRRDGVVARQYVAGKIASETIDCWCHKIAARQLVILIEGVIDFPDQTIYIIQRRAW